MRYSVSMLTKGKSHNQKAGAAEQAARKATKHLMEHLAGFPAAEQEEQLQAFHRAVNEISSSSRAKRKSRRRTSDLRVLYRKRR
jgi:hypothetical protein